VSEQIVNELLNLKGMDSLWPVQQEALQRGLLDSNKNFVIIAPTASGKTLVAELVIFQILKNGGRIVYLVPTKALVNDKVRGLSYLSTKYKIVGTDANVSEWRKANIVITTFELFYRVALILKQYVENFDLAIVDEFHILYDRLRGFNLEKVLIILKKYKVRTICLSATFEDRDEVKDWLEAELVEIPERLRAVPLKQAVLDAIKITRTKQIHAICDFILKKGLFPYIIFCSTKELTRSRALELAKGVSKTIRDKKELQEDFRKTLNRQNLTGLEEDLIECISKGVAFHHSDLDSRLRSYIEELFLNGEVNYLFATTGLAYGINYPAKTVLLWDLSLYNPKTRSSEAIPVYLYLQMVGRAGRPQFGEEGYSYIVIKDAEEQKRVSRYFEGKLERAISHISEDEYFRKAILECIFSGCNRDDEILEFFENSFYNYQSQKGVQKLASFDLLGIMREHVKYLMDNRFVNYTGVSGFILTDLGKITLNFLFSTFAPYELVPFMELDKYLSKEGKVVGNFDLIYQLSVLFEGARLTKLPREKSQEVIDHFEKKGITDLSHSEYSAYAVYYGWMENKDLNEIEEKFKVYASRLPDVANELYLLLQVYEKLAKRRNFEIPPEFKILKDRIRYGVREDELPFVKLKGFGREIVRSLYDYCMSVLTRPPFNYRGNLIEILKNLYQDREERYFIETFVRYAKGIGDARAKKIAEVIKTYI
jgi:helicase